MLRFPAPPAPFAVGVLGVLGPALLACGPAARAAPPNVLLIVWDTTRADHLSLYGYPKATTPFLDEWSRAALVFEDCVSTASSTVPSHGAMFTGLLPTEHGANSAHPYLDNRHTTLAELFLANGYRTYAFAANPHLAREENLVQGFEIVEHPWDAANRERAMRIVRAKIPPQDRSSELPRRLRDDELRAWDIKACGRLANDGLLQWLEHRPTAEPFFAFLNYMEAHRPFLPSAEHRARFMTPEQVARSYDIDRSWDTMWSYTFGLHEYTPEELEVMALTYDACLAELDDLLRDLIARLEAGGYLENTIVVLTGDHGEHLGEHHLLDHQFSLYQGLVHVPLVLSFPGVVPPGRSRDPVSNLDLFPTLLELADIDPPGAPGLARSLLAPDRRRERLAQYPAPFEAALRGAEAAHPEWDAGPFRRRLTALWSGNRKLIRGSDGRAEVYDLTRDPLEEHDLSSTEPPGELDRRMTRLLQRLTPHQPEDEAPPETSSEHRRRLESLGYGGAAGG